MADIGQTLREARMRARIDMTEVEMQTKIRARYLRAIENEEWDLLPGPVYIKSFLRTYADYLGLDSRLLVDEFKRQYEVPIDHDLRPAPSLRQGRERRERERLPRPMRGPIVPPWAIIALVLVAVVVVLYLIGLQNGTKQPNPTSAQTSTRSHHKSTTTTPVRHAKPKPKVAKVKLVPTGTVYICAENRTGHILIPGTTYTTGQAIPTLRGGQIFITLGNNAVTMTANGKPYTVAASAAAIGLKVTPKGVSPLAAASDPTCTTTTTTTATTGAAG
jgi:cytoskeletal protein RodZ